MSNDGSIGARSGRERTNSSSDSTAEEPPPCPDDAVSAPVLPSEEATRPPLPKISNPTDDRIRIVINRHSNYHSSPLRTNVPKRSLVLRLKSKDRKIRFLAEAQSHSTVVAEFKWRLQHDIFSLHGDYDLPPESDDILRTGVARIGALIAADVFSEPIHVPLMAHLVDVDLGRGQFVQVNPKRSLTRRASWDNSWDMAGDDQLSTFQTDLLRKIEFIAACYLFHQPSHGHPRNTASIVGERQSVNLNIYGVFSPEVPTLFGLFFEKYLAARKKISHWWTSKNISTTSYGYSQTSSPSSSVSHSGSDSDNQTIEAAVISLLGEDGAHKLNSVNERSNNSPTRPIQSLPVQRGQVVHASAAEESSSGTDCRINVMSEAPTERAPSKTKIVSTVSSRPKVVPSPPQQMSLEFTRPQKKESKDELGVLCEGKQSARTINVEDQLRGTRPAEQGIHSQGRSSSAQSTHEMEHFEVAESSKESIRGSLSAPDAFSISQRSFADQNRRLENDMIDKTGSLPYFYRNGYPQHRGFRRRPHRGYDKDALWRRHGLYHGNDSPPMYGGTNNVASHVAKDLFSSVLILVTVTLTVLTVVLDPAGEANWFKRIEEGAFVLFSLGVPSILAMNSRLTDNLDILLPAISRPVRSLKDLKNMNKGMQHDIFMKQLAKAVLADEEISDLFSFENASYKRTRVDGMLDMPEAVEYSNSFKKVWFFGNTLCFNKLSGQAFRYRCDDDQMLMIERESESVEGIVVHTRRRGNRYNIGGDPEA